MLVYVTILLGILEHVFATPTDVHIGILAPFSGEWSGIGKRILEVEDYFKNWFEKKMNHTLNDVMYNIIYHHADMQTDLNKMEALAVPFVEGMFDSRTATTWKYSDYTLIKTGQPGVEPSPHKLDALFLHYGSGYIPFALQKLKQAATDIIVYACGSNGLPAWVNDEGNDRWNFATNCGEAISDDEMRPSIQLLAQHGAKTIIFMEQANAGAWTSSLCAGGRNECRVQGIEIIADSVIDFVKCGPLYGTLDFDQCKVNNMALFEKAYSHVIKRGQKYTADAIALCSYSDVCYWLPEYLKMENINVGTIIGEDCKRMMKPEYYKDFIMDVGRYTLDYWLHYQYKSGAEGIYYDQKYNTVGMFPQYGMKSSAGMWKEIQEYRNMDSNEDGGYQEGLFFNGWHFFLEDLHGTKGDLTKLNRFFGKYRPPATSHWSLLSQVPGGWSDMHKTTVLQKFPFWMHGGTQLFVSPADIAQAQASLPAPFWSKRECAGSCVACPKCDQVQELQVTVLACCFAPFVFLFFMAYAVHITSPGLVLLTDVFTYLATCGAFLANIATDIMALLTIFFQMEEEIIDPSSLIPYFYGGFMGLGVLFGIIRVKTQVRGAYVCTFMLPELKDKYYYIQLDMIVVIVSSVLVDLPLLIIQCYTAKVFAASEALIISMLLTAMTVSYGGCCYTEYFNAGIIIGQDEKLNESKDRKSMMNSYMKVGIAPKMLMLFNPCDYEMGLHSKKDLSERMMRVGKPVDGEDKSL